MVSDRSRSYRVNSAEKIRKSGIVSADFYGGRETHRAVHLMCQRGCPMSEAPTLEHRRACHLCEAICGLVIETQGEQILSIKGDPDDPLSRGHICPKGVALQDLHNDPDRLRQPVKRVRQASGSYQHIAVSWDEALDTAAAALVSSVQTHGVDSIGVYLGNPSVHNYGMLTHQGALFKHLRTKNRFSASRSSSSLSNSFSARCCRRRSSSRRL